MQATSIEHAKSRNKTLIVSADPHGYTSTVAHAIAMRLRSLGHDVHFGDALVSRPPPPVDYDAVIFGTEHGERRDRRALGEYIARSREPLERLPTGLFVVMRRPPRDPRQPIEAFETSVGWRAKFAAGIDCKRVGIGRTMMRKIMHFVLRHLEGAIAAENREEIHALVDAMEREVARSVRRS